MNRDFDSRCGLLGIIAFNSTVGFMFAETVRQNGDKCPIPPVAPYLRAILKLDNLRP